MDAHPFQRTRDRVLLSAHRGGCGRDKSVENTWEAFKAAVKKTVEYVEFDIQRTADGVFLLHHDDRIPNKVGGMDAISSLTAKTVDARLGRRVRYTEILALLAETGRKAHLDFKFVSSEHLYATPAETWEVEAVKVAREYLADDEFIVTTAEDVTVRAVRDWADAEGIHLMVGLSIGKHRLYGMRLWQKVQWRVGEMFPERRIKKSGANLVVAQRHLARARLLRVAHKHRLPVLVWTVDSEKELARLMADPRVWMVTSNFPERAPLRAVA